VKFTICTILMIVFSVTFALTSYGDLLVLFDEDAKSEAGGGNIVALFNQHSDNSMVSLDTINPYNGKNCLFCTPTQSYNEKMTGWNFPIKENPKAGEYRYIRFAWKSDGGTGVMIQFPDNGAWGAVTTPCVEPPAPGTRRYIAGVNVTGWTGICLTKDIPKQWTLVERDFFNDFGDFTLTGMALTPFTDGGNGDYYDSIMLAAKESEFPRVNPVESEGKLATLWSEVKSEFR